MSQEIGLCYPKFYFAWAIGTPSS